MPSRHRAVLPVVRRVPWRQGAGDAAAGEDGRGRQVPAAVREDAAGARREARRTGRSGAPRAPRAHSRLSEESAVHGGIRAAAGGRGSEVLPMKILLVAMPDSASCFDHIMELPNLALCSLAGNLEGGHEVRILDLVKHRRRAAEVLERTLKAFSPDLVGISAMSFQIGSARKTAAMSKALVPGVVTVLGGYHATIMWKEIGDGPDGRLFDFVVRGEGEATFNGLVRTLGSSGDLAAIPGLSYRRGEEFRHNPPAPLLDLDSIRPPDRSPRLSGDFLWMGRPFDVAETSRGCTMPCGFCSIRRMYGKTFR